MPALIPEKKMPFPRTTLWRLRRSGRLTCYRVGRRVYYDPKHLEMFLKTCELRGQNREGRA